MFLYFINTTLFYDTRYDPCLHPSFSTTLYLYTHYHNSQKKLNMYNLSTHPPHVPPTTYPSTLTTSPYIHPSLNHICLPLQTLYLSKPFSNTHYQPSHTILIPFLSHINANTHSTYHPHTPLSPLIIQLQNTIFSVLFTSTIPPLAPFQCSFIKTPPFHYLNVTTSPHSTPSYHTHPHHSFFTKVLTYLLHTHSHRPFTSSPCPYISFSHQYIYPSNTRTKYQLLSILSSPLYYKLSLSSISTLNRTPPPKYLILYPLHPYLATHRNNHTPTHMSSHILRLILSLRPKYLILSLKCVVYHIIHHFHTPLTTKYFLVSTYLFLPLRNNIATNHGLGWCDTTLLHLSIPSFISPQSPSPHTPPFQYLRTTSIFHNTPYHHHSLSIKLSNLPIISYSYHTFPPNHYPYISSNSQYIYPINPLIQILIYQLPSISFILIYYKLTLSSLSTIHRILTLKNPIFYPITKYSSHAHYDTHLTNHIPIKKSYYTLLLSSSHPSNHLIYISHVNYIIHHTILILHQTKNTSPTHLI
jgi:hypothetical protein